MTSKPPKTRKSVSLTREDLEELEAMRSSDSAEAQAFAELTGVRVGAHTSEAAMIHGLIEIGQHVVREKALDLAYKRAARVDAEDPERQMWRAGMRNRRRGGGVTHP